MVYVLTAIVTLVVASCAPAVRPFPVVLQGALADRDAEARQIVNQLGAALDRDVWRDLAGWQIEVRPVLDRIRCDGSCDGKGDSCVILGCNERNGVTRVARIEVLWKPDNCLHETAFAYELAHVWRFAALKNSDRDYEDVILWSAVKAVVDLGCPVGPSGNGGAE